MDRRSRDATPRSSLLILAGIGAMLIAVAAIVAVFTVYMLSDDNAETRIAAPTQPQIDTPLGGATSAPTIDAEPPTAVAALDAPTPLPTVPPPPTLPPVDWTRPTAAPDVIAAALDQPALMTRGESVQRVVDPWTIIPARARSDVMTYQVRRGDTLGDIAKRFGLQENTIIWSNDAFYVNAMRVGMKLTILPVDGVYHRVQQPQTITEIAEEFEVQPYAIIDSEYNTLFGTTPETILPVGLYVVVPDGTGSTEPIYWDPGIVMTSSSSGSGAGAVGGYGSASFAIGEPGSCGTQPVNVRELPVTSPIWRNYRITQEFTWIHGGIDLAVPEGTPVYAAAGGTVIFSGWSTWGYGYTVVLAHGGTLTLYGHLNGAFVSCGEAVTAGQNIAVSGNSGNSSGPHLHFEIRGANGRPVNPWDYQKF